MRRRPDVTTVLGCAALAASLALLSPGVRAVRADDAPPAAAVACSSDGPTCEARGAGTEPADTDAERRIREHEIERQKQLAAVAAGGVVVLNNRGYNYAPEDGPLRGGPALSNER